MGSGIWGAGALMQWWTPLQFLQDTAQATRLSLDRNQVERVVWIPNVFSVTKLLSMYIFNTNLLKAKVLSYRLRARKIFGITGQDNIKHICIVNMNVFKANVLSHRLKALGLLGPLLVPRFPGGQTTDGFFFLKFLRYLLNASWVKELYKVLQEILRRITLEDLEVQKQL